MKPNHRLLFALVAMLVLACPFAATAQPVSGIEAGFSPGNAEALVVHAIDGAQRSVLVAAYSFTSRPIATALLNAKTRGVSVMAVVDKSQQSARNTSAAFIANHGIPVRTDSRYAIMHNKFLVIDQRTVETGSFNYTKAAALKNAENVVVIHSDPALAAIYAREWTRLWNESTPYVREASLGGDGDRRYTRKRNSERSW